MDEQVRQTSAESTDKGEKKPVEKNDNSWRERLREELRINPKFLPYKVFFFVFFAGFGLFPYLPLYYKQLGLSASLVGLLAGIRPIIQFIGSPFWSVLADKFQARKCILLFSIVAWLVMTLALLLPVPRHTYCKELKLGNYSIQNNSSDDFLQARERRTRPLLRNPSRTFAFSQAGISAIKWKFPFIDKVPSEKTLLMAIPSQDKEPGKSGEKPTAYLLERDEHELNSVFMWLLVLTVTGEFLEVPSFILADTALLQKLGDKTKDYGKTRLFGSIGFAGASFAIGGLLDNTQYTYCGRQMNNYNVIFYLFASVMAVAFVLAAWMFEFNYDHDEMADSDNNKTSSILSIFLKFTYAFCITITWFLGFNHGLLFNFLNWYLEDLGASKLLMGTGVLCRAVSLSLAFFFHGFLVDIFGHLPLILWTLASYVFLFSCFSVIIDPWWAIPLELYHGLVFGTSWSTLVVYLADATPKGGAATMQGILQGVYWGLGGGIGAILGGIVIDKYGTVPSFRIGAILSAAVLVASAIVQFGWFWILRKTASFKSPTNSEG